MKKIILILLLILAYTSLNAQNNLFEELKKYEGQKYKVYQLEVSDGKLFFEDQEYWTNLKTVKDKYGNGIGVSMQHGEKYNSFKDWEFNPRYDRIDNYKEPAYCGTIKGGRALVMIDGILLKLKDAKENLNRYSIGYSYVYVPKSIIESSEKTKKKKKGKFKAFLKNVAKEAVSGVPPAPAYLKSIETQDLLKAKVKDYITAMHKKQKANPLNAQDKKRWQEVIDMKKKAEEEIAEYNRKFYASEKGQAQLKRLEENRRRSGSSSSSSSSSGGASAKVQVKYRNVGNNSMYVYYTKPNGSQGKGRITKGSSDWFTVKAGSNLYYTTDDNGSGRNKQFLVKSKTTGNAYVEK